MAYYVALKPCRFAGKEFLIGDHIPAELLQPGAAPALIKMGKIANPHAEKATPAAPAIVAPVSTNIELTVPVEEGRLALDITKEGLQAIFDVLTAKVDDAEKIIDEMTDSDALILLHIVDGRKSIKTAAEERAQAIVPEDEDEEGAAEDSEEGEH